MKTKLLVVRLWYSTSGYTEFIKKEIYGRVHRNCDVLMWHRWNYISTGDADLYCVVNALSRKYDGIHAVQLPCTKRISRLVCRH